MVTTRSGPETWTRVCGSGFGLTEAAVVCAELDCGSVSELHQEALFSEGKSFHCDGAEASLTKCESSEKTLCSSAVNLTCSGNSTVCTAESDVNKIKLRTKKRIGRPLVKLTATVSSRRKDKNTDRK